MRRRSPLIFLALVLTMSPLTASAEAPREQNTTDRNTSAFEWIGATTITETSFTLNNPYRRLKDLRPDAAAPTTSGLKGETSFLNGALRAESELARNDESGDTTTPWDRSGKSMMRLAVKGDYGALRYGASFRHADKQFLNTPDQRVREIWGEWGTGLLRLRSVMTNLTTNVDADPTRARLAMATNRMSMLIARPNWPELSVSYIRTLTDTQGFQSGLTSERQSADAVEGALAITRESWNARISSTYSRGENPDAPSQSTLSYIHMLTSVFRPLEPLSITSVVSYRMDTQQWTGVRTDRPVASLALHYRHSSRWTLTAMGGYTGVRTTDGMTDNETINSKGVLTWSPGGSLVHQVSFETGYSRTVMGGVAGGGMVTEDLSGLVKFRLTQF